MSLHHEVRWAEREDKVYLTVMLAEAKDVKVNLHPDGVFTFSGSAGADNKCYKLKLELFAKVDVNESKVNTGVKKIFCILMKAEKKWWNKLLHGDGKSPHYVKVDWDKWIDEDDDEAPTDVDTSGMDFSKFGSMAGGMGGGSGNMGSGYGSMGGKGQLPDPDMSNFDDGVPRKLVNMSADVGRHPEVRWAEREDKVYLTVMCADAKDAKVYLDPEGVFTFSGSYGGGRVYNCYKLKLDLLDKVVVEESKVNIGAEKILCILMKAEKKWWKKLLHGDGKSPPYVKMDWDKWVDKDDDKAPCDVDTGLMDFSKFGDLGDDSGDLGGGTIDIDGMVFDFDGFSEKDGNLVAHYKYRKYYEMLRRMGLSEDVDDSSLVTLSRPTCGSVSVYI